MKVALISTTFDSLSETFIRRHRDLMDANVVHYYGGYPSTHNSIEGRFGLKQVGYYFDTVLDKLGLKSNVKERALARSLKANEIDLCYAEFGPNGVGAMKACESLNIPLVVNFHGYDIHKFDVLKSYKSRYQELFDIAQSVVAVSREMEKKLIALGCGEHKIQYLPCAPDDKFFNLSPQKSNMNLLCVGRFVDKKAPHLAILSCRSVLAKHPTATLTMIGDGPLLTSCKALVKALKMERVVFTGAIDHNEVLRHFENTSIFIQHSVTDENGNKEGTPVSVMEASAAGIPVVSTRHAGIPDVILDGETGLLVDEFDIDSMSQKIDFLLEHSAKADDMGENGRLWVMKQLGPASYKERLNSIIKSAQAEACMTT